MTERVSYLTLLPGYRVREPLAMTGIQSVVTPWGDLHASAMRGVRQANESGFLVLMYENPLLWMQPESPMDKKDLELLHLRKLAVDCRAATGSELFDEVIETGETPDFRTRTEGREIGWEMTQLAIEQRRLAQELFFEVTERVEKLPRGKIKQLFGQRVYMWFGEARDAAGLPFRRHDAEAYERLVEAVVAYHPDPELFRTDGEIPPAMAPPYPVHEISDVQFFAVPMMNAFPANRFQAMTGTSFGLAFQSEHDAADEWAKLQDVVRRKDKPSNDILVISAGAPDRMGRCYVTEELLAQLLLDHPSAIHAEHLGAVWLHFWGTGRTFSLLGDAPQELWPASFAGIAPAAQFIQRAQPPLLDEAAATGPA